MAKQAQKRAFLILIPLLLVGTLATGIRAQENGSAKPLGATIGSGTKESSAALPSRAYAILAGGCFWCVESDFEKLPGVVEVIAGYSGGRTSQPTYKTYASGGHREVVSVIYDPTQINYSGLVEYLLKHIDATDRRGQFKDQGMQYSPAIFYRTEEEKLAAEEVVKAIDAMKVFANKKVGVSVLPEEPFWVAEAYHQDYYKKNPVPYQEYRVQSGRDAFIASVWGLRAKKLELPNARPEAASAKDIPTESVATEAEKAARPWLTFRKPSNLELRKKLSAIQYRVTQQDGTEPARNNMYWNNKRPGIYVDVVSGAPLFSSTDKFKSGTGWPSFVKPITEDAVNFKFDFKLGVRRVEVRSRYGDSHLGHVFNDGPRNRGGKRYCMNSASLRFIPKEDMEKEGYAEFLKMVE